MSAPEGTEPDLILLSERVLPMADVEGPRDGLAIRDGRIDQLVARADVDSLRGERTQVIDVGQRPVLPGFIDVHAHAEVACRTAFETVDCRAPGCSSVDDVLTVLSDALAEGSSDWVVGQANLFFDRKVHERRLPTRDELDRVSRTAPVALRAGGHVTVLNTRALELAGIDRSWRPPTGSITGKPAVIRDDDGDATGVVKEMDNLLPFPRPDDDRLSDALETGLRSMFTRYGVTTIGEISETVEGIQCMDGLCRRGRLPVRMRVYLWAPGTLSLADACSWQERLRLQAAADQLAIRGVKLFADGGYSAASAAVKRPYIADGKHAGDIALTEDFVTHALSATQEAGLQLAIHANGDRAQEWLCDVIARAGGAPTGKLRTRIEHAGNFLPDPATVDAWRRAGIVPVPQPVFLYTFGEYFPDYLGDYGLRGRFPFASLLSDGWRLSGSSDVWVGSERDATNPLFSVWCSVKRETYAGSVLDEGESLTVEQALRMHTRDAAWVLAEDDVKGTLEPGKLADIVVLERDPRAVPVDEIRKIAVDRVFVGGRSVYAHNEPNG